MVDVVISRTPFPLSEVDLSAAVCPLVNGGDASVEHPTQALIDLSAMTTYAGPVEGLRIAVCGDPRMRAVSSLLSLLTRRPPRELRIVAPRSRQVDWESLAPPLRAVTTVLDGPDVDGVDVLYLPGLPMARGDDSLDDVERARFAFDDRLAAALPQHAVVLSPLPVIDEIAASQRLDPRLRMWQQSDRAVAVRAAVLEWCLGQGE
jgi:aspartate carbamoyltransferase catalytic subunit